LRAAPRRRDVVLAARTTEKTAQIDARSPALSLEGAAKIPTGAVALHPVA
jgi:hypothetical protein